MTQETQRYVKPLPQPDAESDPYWNALKGHRLLVPHCKDCGEYYFYPRSYCPFCHTTNVDMVESKGKGKLHTFTIIRQNLAPGFREEVPYVVGVVELDEGNVQLMTNIVECDVAEVQIGMPVKVVYDDVTPEITLPKFKPD